MPYLPDWKNLIKNIKGEKAPVFFVWAAKRRTGEEKESNGTNRKAIIVKSLRKIKLGVNM